MRFPTFKVKSYLENFRIEKTFRNKVFSLLSRKFLPKFEINLLRNKGFRINIVKCYFLTMRRGYIVICLKLMEIEFI